MRGEDSAAPVPPDEPVLRVTVRPGPPCTVVVCGELDIDGASLVATTLTQVLASAPATVEIDAGEIRFVDSSGLRCLIEARQDITSSGARFRLIASEPGTANNRPCRSRPPAPRLLSPPASPRPSNPVRACHRILFPAVQPVRLVQTCGVIGRLEKTVIDCPDPHALARFYAAVLGMQINENLDDWVVIGIEPGERQLAFQRVEKWVPPRWPDPDHPQQLHLDIRVDDIDTAEAAIIELGATRVHAPRETGFHVYVDPAGHPFCLVFGPLP
jgi:anti-anti-sigma factor